MARSRALFLAVGLGAWLASSPAEAASIKSVQTNTETMSTQTRTVTLPQAVDATKAFVVCSNRTNGSSPSYRVTCELSNTTVTITSGTTVDTTEVVRWYVVEFEGGVSVRRGLESIQSTKASATTPVNVALSTVDLAKSFVLISERTNSTSTIIDEEWTIRARLTSGTNLELTRNETGIAMTVAWQVVQMEGASVQRNVTTINAGAASATATISSVDTTKSFLVMSRRGAGASNGIEAEYQVRGELTNTTTLTFTRGTTTNSVDIAWEVVSLSDGSTVQKNTTSTAATTDATLNATLSLAIDTLRTVPFISASGASGTSTASLDETSWTASLTTTTNLQFQRTGTGTNGSVAWFVVQFFTCPPAPPDVAYVAATAQSGQVTVQWSSPYPVLILRDHPFAVGSTSPQKGTTYTVGNQIGFPYVVYNGSVAESSFTDTGLVDGMTNGTTYYYKVFAKNGTGTGNCYSSGTNVEVSVAPRAAPQAWTWAVAGSGFALNPGIAGWDGTLSPSSNASRLFSLNTGDGTQRWLANTSAAVQGWLSWIPTGSAGVKSLQSGTATMPVGTATTQTVNVPISAADMTKSVLFFTARVSSVDPGDGQVRGQLTSPTNVQFTRPNATSLSPVTIRWSVVEFSGGVRVQRDTALVANTTSNVTIAAVDLAKSFVLTSCQMSAGDTGYNDNDYLRARLTSSTNLEFGINVLQGPGFEKPCDWQVVEHAGVSVQRGIGSLASTANTSGPITISAVDLTKSFVHVTWKPTSTAGTQTGADFLRARLTGPTTIEIDRGATGTGIEYAWEVVSFTDGTTVQSGNLTFTDAQTNLTAAINVDPTRAVAFLSAYQRGGRHAYTQNDNVGPGWFTATIENSTTLRVERDTTGITGFPAGALAADAAWFVVQFAPSSTASVIGSVIGGDQGGQVFSVDAVAGTSNWTWDLTSLGGEHIQAPVAAQLRAYSNGLSTDLLFVATLNSTGTVAAGQICGGTAETNNKLFALEASTGAVVWVFNNPMFSNPSPPGPAVPCPYSMDRVSGMPYVDYARNQIYVTSRAGSAGDQPSLWVIDTLTGDLKKSLALGHIDGSPTLSYDGTTIYVNGTTSTTSTLYGVNADTTTWGVGNVNAVRWSFPLPAADVVVKGFVWEDWQTRGRLYFSTSKGFPVTNGDSVWAVQDGSATPLWQTEVAGASTPLPLGALYVGSSDGRLHQLDLSTGTDSKQFPATGNLDNASTAPSLGPVSTEWNPATGDYNWVFVSTSGGKVYKINVPLP